MGIVTADSNVSAVRMPAIRLASPPSCLASMYDAGEAGQAANSMTITNVSPESPINIMIRAAITGMIASLNRQAIVSAK